MHTYWRLTLGAVFLLAGVLLGLACGPARVSYAGQRYNPATSRASPSTTTRAATTAGATTTASTRGRAMAQRRTIYFSGRVQGVGFRYTAVQLARDLPVGGTVRNLDDGRVELVVEGEKKDIDELINRLREHFGSFIRNIQQTTGAARGEADGLRVTH